MYAYCLNNPINDIDSSGNLSWWQWLLVGIGAALVVAATVILTVASGGAFAGVAGAVLVGAAKGALIGAAIGTAAGGIIGGATSGWSLDGILTGMAIGFGAGAVVGAITGAISSTIKIANAAKMWDKGTFKSGYQSMKYHYKTHVINQGFSKGNNIIKYTNDAISFMNKNSSLLKLTYSSKYDMIRWIYSSDTAQGFYTSLGKIITFILKG